MTTKTNLSRSTFLSASGADLRAADMFRGLGAQLARTTGLLLLIFVPYDHIRRSTGLLAPAPSADGPAATPPRPTAQPSRTLPASKSVASSAVVPRELAS